MQIARDLREKYNTVYKVINRGGQGAKQTGRPRKIGIRIERQIVRAIKKQPDKFSTELAHEFCPEVNPRTVRRLLIRNGFRNCAKRKNLLSLLSISQRV